MIKLPCRSYETALDDICDRCRNIMQDEIINWKLAQEVLNNHNFPSFEDAKKLLVGSDELLEQAKSKHLKWTREDYKIVKDINFKQQYTILPNLVRRTGAMVEESKEEDVPEYLRATVYDEINIDDYVKE